MKKDRIRIMMVASILALSVGCATPPVPFIEQEDSYPSSIHVETVDTGELAMLINYHIDLQSAHELFVINLGNNITPQNEIMLDMARKGIDANADMVVHYQEIYYAEIGSTYDPNTEVEPELEYDHRQDEYPTAYKVWHFLTGDLGYSDYVAAGIIGNMMSECGGNTLALHGTIYSPSKIYYGLCQWHSKYHSEIHGASVDSQLLYLKGNIQAEINMFGENYSPGFTYNDFLNLTNPKDAARAFAKCYERCGSNSTVSREDNAIVAYEYFSD